MNNTTNTVKRPALAAVGAPVALLLIFAATLVPFFMAGSDWATQAYPYVYSAGAVALLAVRLFTPYRGRDFRLKRLHRIESWIAIIFCAGAFFLFYNNGLMLRDWLAFTLAGAALQIITSIAIPMREARLARGNGK